MALSTCVITSSALRVRIVPVPRLVERDRAPCLATF